MELPFGILAHEKLYYNQTARLIPQTGDFCSGFRVWFLDKEPPSTRRTDKCFLLLGRGGEEKEGNLLLHELACQTNISYCDHLNASERFQRFDQSLYLHFACLAALSQMRSHPAIHCFLSASHEPYTSNLHTKMSWHRWFHPNTADRPV